MRRKTLNSTVLVPIFFIGFHFDSRLLYYTKYTVGRIHIETKCRSNHVEAVKEGLENLGKSLNTAMEARTRKSNELSTN